MIQKIVVGVIKFYQIFIPPTFKSACRFYPSCSQYTLKTIEKYGVLKGGLKGLKRILKCHPFTRGGIDLP